ncbi:uncharacterized protein LOC114289863 [Camellia sinensis]|uniref:uncharacterized protein LOC114289863 n=1 Tax=Camellia sinensis TaxID=4442 RepID=UPI0010360FE8|nr:uncharacterized protein LOC114289863 [Camellia sinensis]
MDSSGHNSTAHSNTPSSTRGNSGEVGPCKKVSGDIQYRMEEALKAIIEKNKRSEESNPFGWAVFEVEDDAEIEEIIPQRNKGILINEGGGSKNKSSQPTIKSALATKEAVHRAHMIVAKFLYDTRVPMNVVNSIYFQPMFDAAMPWVQDIKFLPTIKCTIMGNGWTDGRHRTLINFFVYCPRGITFVKSVDASDVVKNAPLLFKLFEEIIEWVGASNTVHMVTDDGANYVAAGRLVSETYKNINWSPCAAHCLNLVLNDISKLNHVKELASRASSVTRFIYNRPWLIAWLRKRKGWTEIVRPEAARFATTFIGLHSIQKHMHDLKALVTSKDFVNSRHAKDKKVKEVVAIILDSKFSNDCLIVIKIVEPLMRLLRIVDGDKKPSMGYVYEGMYRARIAIKNVFMKKKRLYKPYTSIIKDCWDRTLRKNIHAAAY